MTDLFDFDDHGLYRTNYIILKYVTYVTNNTFRNNFSGKKGTALMVSGVNLLNMFNNVFEKNGPTTALQEMKYSPYYEFL